MRPPSPPDPAIISWSSLRRWENCPHHQLRVIEHKTQRQEKGRIFLPGTLCDLTQRRWLDSPNPQPGEMTGMIDKIFDEIVERGESKIHWKGNPTDDQQAVKAHCKKMVLRQEAWLLEHVIPYHYQAEVKFKAHMQVPYICDDRQAPVTLIGGIDLVVQPPGGKFRLYDLKITSDDGYIKSTLGQLTFYDLAWGIIQGDFYHADEWGFLTPGLSNITVPVTVSREDRQVMLSRIIKYAQGVWSDSWAPKASDTGCTWCEARSVCDKFKVIAVVDENGKQRVSFAQAAAQKAAFRAAPLDRT